MHSNLPNYPYYFLNNTDFPLLMTCLLNNCLDLDWEMLLELTVCCYWDLHTGTCVALWAPGGFSSAVCNFADCTTQYFTQVLHYSTTCKSYANIISVIKLQFPSTISSFWILWCILYTVPHLVANSLDDLVTDLELGH